MPPLAEVGADAAVPAPPVPRPERAGPAAAAFDCGALDRHVAELDAVTRRIRQRLGGRG